MPTWVKDSIFYHIYPLGFCGAPQTNDFKSPMVPRLEKIYGWLDHLAYLQVNAVYLGPVFESSTHGYDTVDYYHVDRRLGSNEILHNLAAEMHRRGIRLVLDAVFNHVGRDFWAFRDVQQNGERSHYKDWFNHLSFDGRSPYGDPFTYQGWSGHYNLVKLNLQNQAVRSHIFDAVREWVRDYEIDGLRLDAADVMDHTFLADLATFTRNLRPDFWLMGEVVHGDYSLWANPAELHSVTNYECYKGLYSSHNDRNYFEIAYSFNRQFGESGIYKGLDLYNFVDNHDVNRVASMLENPSHLLPLYTLLFTMPGVPSIYYGSEFGIEGKKNGTDTPLRPDLNLYSLIESAPQRELAPFIHRLATLRHSLPALRYGDYHQLHVGSQSLAFVRQTDGQSVLVGVNSSDKPVNLRLSIPHWGGRLVDLLNDSEELDHRDNELSLNIPSCWGRVISFKN